MRYIKSLILFGLICSLFGFFNPISFVDATTDIPYEINRDILYSSNNLTRDQMYNMRYRRIYSDNYTSTYNFLNESNYVIPNFWENISIGTGNAQIIPNSTGHNKVVELYHGLTGADDCGIQNNFTVQTSMTLELWIKSTDTTRQTYILLFDNIGTQAITFRIVNDQFQLHDGGGWEIMETTPLDNYWFHIRLDLECGVGGYLGLSADTFNVYINQYFEGTYDFGNPSNNLQRLRFWCDSGAEYYNYIDAIAYYPLDVNYTVNDNFFPFIQITEILELDKYEFMLKGINELYDEGDDLPQIPEDPEGLAEQEYDYGDYVNIGDGDYMEITSFGNGKIRGVRKDNHNIDCNYINLSIGFEIFTFNASGGYLEFEIYSKDDTNIFEIFIFENGSLQYTDNGDLIEIISDISLNKFYTFNILIDYSSNLCYFDYFIDNIYNRTFLFPLIWSGKQGLKRIHLYSRTFDSAPNNINWIIDYVGIYTDGISKCAEYGYITFPLNKEWNCEHHNLIDIVAKGNFSLGIIEGLYEIEESYTTVAGFTQFNNESQVVNAYDGYIGTIENATLIFTLKMSSTKVGNFSFYSLNIEGVRLTQNSNNYWLEFTHGGVNINKNYFYADNNHKLRFIHTSNDVNLEYIQAKFDITSVPSTNRSIKFEGTITDNAKGFFRVNYTEQSTIITIPNTPTVRHVLLVQDLEINDFIILITDNDDNTINGTSEGYVFDIKLRYIVNIDIAIVTLSLISILIPLIVMFVPTLGAYSRYGKDALIPMFILMSLICVITSLIPIWLFLIIVISLSLFLFMSRKEEGL